MGDGSGTGPCMRTSPLQFIPIWTSQREENRTSLWSTEAKVLLYLPALRWLFCYWATYLLIAFMMRAVNPPACQPFLYLPELTITIYLRLLQQMANVSVKTFVIYLPLGFFFFFSLLVLILLKKRSKQPSISTSNIQQT